jgi:hypothetical protein
MAIPGLAETRLECMAARYRDPARHFESESAGSCCATRRPLRVEHGSGCMAAHFDQIVVHSACRIDRYGRIAVGFARGTVRSERGALRCECGTVRCEYIAVRSSHVATDSPFRSARSPIVEVHLPLEVAHSRNRAVRCIRVAVW